MTERLINKGTNGEFWVSDTDCTRAKGKLQAVMEKLYKYETSEEEGRLVVLPCKVGDTVYVIENRRIKAFKVNIIELKHKVFGNITYYFEKPSRRGCLYGYYDSEFGDNWFITREEAEKALKEMEGKH